MEVDIEFTGTGTLALYVQLSFVYRTGQLSNRGTTIGNTMILRGGTDENCRIKLVGRILVFEKIEFRHLSNITLELGSYETILFHSSYFFPSTQNRSIIDRITILGTTCISLRYTNYLTNNRNLTKTSISTNIEGLQF